MTQCRSRAASSCHKGTKLKTAFTNFDGRRYGAVAMLLFAAAAALAASTPSPVPRAPTGATVQARATIRIISGVVVKMDRLGSGEGFIARDSVVRAAGIEQPARLVEFQ